MLRIKEKVMAMRTGKSAAGALMAAALVAVALAGGCSRSKASKEPVGGPDAALLRAAVQPATARLEATIYEVRVPPAKVGDLDATLLADAASLPRALEVFGSAKVLYKVDQVMDLAKDAVEVGTRQPTVTATRMTDAGRAVSTVQYQQVGAIFQVSRAAAEPPDGQGDVQVDIEISALTESGAAISEGVPAMSVRNARMVHRAPLVLGRPFILLTVDAASKDAQGNAVAYVCRAVFLAAQP
jgi:hypothetical protein